MCIILIGLWLLLLCYAHDRIAVMQLAEQVGSQSVSVAQGWELVTVLWPLSLLLFFSGMLTVMLAVRFRSMFRGWRSDDSSARE